MSESEVLVDHPAPIMSADKPRLKAADIRLLANQKSLLHPLSYLVNDFREQIRVGLIRYGHDIQTTQAKVLVHLDMEGTRLTELAQRAGITKQAMGKVVDALEESGYVFRKADTDGRAKVIRFTPKGLQLLNDSNSIVNEVWQEYAQLVGEEQLESFQHNLQELFLKVRAAR